MCEGRRGGGGGGVGGTKTQKLTTKELEIKKMIDSEGTTVCGCYCTS